LIGLNVRFEKEVLKEDSDFGKLEVKKNVGKIRNFII
jgi:hypothetical protein